MITNQRVARLMSAFLLLAGCIACEHSNSSQDLSVKVDAAHPAAALPDDFLGLSFEASVLGSDRLAPSGSNLPALLRNLGAGHLRFGGNSLDRIAPWVADPGVPLPPWAKGRVTPADLGNLGALSAATGWRVDLGVTLGHPDPAAAASEAVAAVRLIGPGLGTIEIGNEPDEFATDKALKPSGYTYRDYLAEVGASRTAIAAAAPAVRVAGPDTAGLTWLPAYAQGQGSGLSHLTQHFYPLTRCGGRRPTITELLSSATRQRETSAIERAVVVARQAGLPVRFDETNSASCGGQDGVSNTLASALWIVDYLLLAGQRGVAGVDVHGGLAACRGYTPLCVPRASGAVAGSRPGIGPVADASLGAAAGEGPLAVQPDFYGLLLVRQLEGGRWLPVRSDPPSPLHEFALLMPDGSIRVVLVNLSPKLNAHVVIRAGGRRTLLEVLRLTGPSLGATSGVRFGGAAVGADGTWAPVPSQPTQQGPGGSDGVAVDLARASSAVVSLSHP
jgi:hypothetical protein